MATRWPSGAHPGLELLGVPFGGLHEGDEVDVIEEGDTLRIMRTEASQTRGQRLVARMRGRASTTMSTDQLLGLLRD